MCLLLSFGVWLVMNLSRVNVSDVTVRVIAVSNITGRSPESVSDVSISARCSASGFRIVGLERRKRPVRVRFDADDFTRVGEDLFILQDSDLRRYVSDIFGEGVEVGNFLAKSYQFRFSAEKCVKVPVVAVAYLTFRPQYMAASDMEISPDSVYVYGKPEILAGVGRITTEVISLRDLDSDARGRAALEVPEGVRLSEADAEYSLDVTRFVELVADKPVRRRNLPQDADLAVLPGTVRLTVRCPFPLGGNPLDNAEVYVDYADFVRSVSGKCAVRFDGGGGDFLYWKCEPDFCDCVVR